jgi:hypothetical protein
MTVTPVSFLTGVVVAFLGCCLAGRLLSQHNPYKRFTRFHHYIHLETYVYPTASQVRALARERLDPNKIAVIVGSNSILHGVGQRVEHVWTRRLQKVLGDDYCVLNLAVFSAEAAEFGAVIAEALAAEYPRLIFITGFGSGKGLDTPDGSEYRYFYYDALYKGMIRPDADRDAFLVELDRKRVQTEGDKTVELRQGRRIDSALFFQDLWTTCTVRWINTIWSHLLYERVTAPRLVYPDFGGRIPIVQSPQEREKARRIIHGFAEALVGMVFGPQAVPPPWGQEVKPDPARSPLVQRFEVCFPAPLRRHTLILMTHDSPEYVDELEPMAKARYRWVIRKAAEVLEAGGFAALDVGGDFSRKDYVDQLHLSERGGDKLANRVAGKVRAMAGRLGYTDQD